MGPVAKRGWQTHWHKHLAVRSGDQLTLGERPADRMRAVMGSWPFVFCFFAIMIIWAVVNTVLFHRVLHHKATERKQPSRRAVAPVTSKRPPLTSIGRR